MTKMPFRDGRKIVRDASFRKRDAAKLERAQAIKARSSCLSSHLVTPGPVRRSVDHSAVSVLRETGTNGKVAPHSVTITPRKVENAERGPLTESAYEPALRIPPHASATKGTRVATAAPAPAAPAPVPAAAPKPTNGAIGAASRANGEEGRAIKRRAKGDKAKKQLDSFSVLAKAGAARPQ